MKDYKEYYIQGSDHYLIPKEEFEELLDRIDKAIASIELGYVVFCEQDKECLINFRKNILEILKGEE